MKEKFCAYCGRMFSAKSVKVGHENVFFHIACLRNRNFEKEKALAMASSNITMRGSLYHLVPKGDQ